MVRKDFPTNREIQVDFTTQARDVFVAAAERELEAKITDFNPAFADKPLDHLTLTFKSAYRRTQQPHGIHRERLRIEPLQMSTAEGLRSGQYSETHELFKGADPSVLEHYKTIAKVIGESTITDDFRFGQIPPAGVEAEWTADRDSVGSRKYHASTFKERASKQSLVSAKLYVADAQSYVESDVFTKDLMVRFNDSVLNGISEDLPRHMVHEFNLRISPDLPINGHEPRAFIEHYVQKMQEVENKQQAILDRVTDLGAPQLIQDYHAELVTRHKKARVAAQKFL